MNAIPYLELTDANLSTSVPEDTNPVWVSGGPFVVGDLRHRVETHRVYKCTAANGGTTPPEDDATNWQDIGPTNAWAMFDRKNGSQTKNADAISFTITPQGLVNSLALFNIDAVEMTITMSTVADGVVYQNTIDLVVRDPVDWEEFWFKEPVRKRRQVIDDLPLYLDATIDITLTDTGGIAKCGTFMIGMQKHIGETVWGSRGGIRDFSRKDSDEFGNWSVTKRAFRDRDSFDVEVPTAKLENIRQFLADYRAEPMVWVGSNLYEGMITFAFCIDFEVNYSNAVISHLTLQLEGLSS